MKKKFNNSLNGKFHKKISRLNAIHFENSKFLENLELAMQGIYSVDYYLFNIIGLIIKDVPYLIFLSVYLGSLRDVLLLAPVIIFIPIIISQILNTVEKRKLTEETIYLNRKLNHYTNILNDGMFVKETRMLGTFNHFYILHSELLKTINSKNWKCNFRAQMIGLISKLINLIGYYVVLWLLFDSLMNKFISIGEFAAIFAYIQKMYSTLENMVVNRIGNMLSYDYNGIKHFIKFLDEEEDKYGDKEYKLKNKIELKNISFSYPGREESAISNINLTINKGDTIAFVGLNGSGKSTLAKIILGLYSPTSGNIEYDNLEKNSYNKKSFNKNKSAVFQDFYKYLFSLKDNISISDPNFTDDIPRLENSCVKADLKMTPNVFPQGFETVLSKQFGGIDLSGGEWQRVAIARGFYRFRRTYISY